MARVMAVKRMSGRTEFFYFPACNEDKINGIRTWNELMELAWHRSDRLSWDAEVVRTVTEEELRRGIEEDVEEGEERITVRVEEIRQMIEELREDYRRVDKWAREGKAMEAIGWALGSITVVRIWLSSMVEEEGE